MNYGIRSNRWEGTSSSLSMMLTLLAGRHLPGVGWPLHNLFREGPTAIVKIFLRWRSFIPSGMWYSYLHNSRVLLGKFLTLVQFCLISLNFCKQFLEPKYHNITIEISLLSSEHLLYSMAVTQALEASQSDWRAGLDLELGPGTLISNMVQGILMLLVYIPLIFYMNNFR